MAKNGTFWPHKMWNTGFMHGENFVDFELPSSEFWPPSRRASWKLAPLEASGLFSSRPIRFRLYGEKVLGSLDKIGEVYYEDEY